MVNYLLFVDGSDNSNRALQFLKNKLLNSNNKGDKITLMHFVHRIENSWLNPISDNLNKLSNIEEEQKSKDLEKNYIEKCKKSFPDEVQWRYISIIKENAEDVIEAIKEQNPDIVVVGTRGNGFLKKMFLGSFSEMVLKHSPYPVLIIP
ncbi:hypothetical protein ACTFIY_006297 [Dictyostelium cf. discoideum]